MIPVCNSPVQNVIFFPEINIVMPLTITLHNIPRLHYDFQDERGWGVEGGGRGRKGGRAGGVGFHYSGTVFIYEIKETKGLLK